MSDRLDKALAAQVATEVERDRKWEANKMANMSSILGAVRTVHAALLVSNLDCGVLKLSDQMVAVWTVGNSKDALWGSYILEDGRFCIVGERGVINMIVAEYYYGFEGKLDELGEQLEACGRTLGVYVKVEIARGW